MSEGPNQSATRLPQIHKSTQYHGAGARQGVLHPHMHLPAGVLVHFPLIAKILFIPQPHPSTSKSIHPTRPVSTQNYLSPLLPHGGPEAVPSRRQQPAHHCIYPHRILSPYLQTTWLHARVDRIGCFKGVKELGNWNWYAYDLGRKLGGSTGHLFFLLSLELYQKL